MSRERVVLSLPAGDAGATVLLRARRRGFRRFLLPAGAPAFEPEPGEEIYRPDGGRIAGPGAGSGSIPILRVRHPPDLDPVLARLRAGSPVAVAWEEERLIPLETLVAARTVPGTLWVLAARLADLPGDLGALEHGADSVVIDAPDPEALDRIEALLEAAGEIQPLVRAVVRRVVPAGMGDRVLVDTTSLLLPEEGLLIGSSAAFLVQVASEATGSRYTRARPFRVNAGSAHSYTLLPNGETRYLSELSAGDAVLIVGAGGSSRSAHVGRIKIERRPLVLVEVEHEGARFTAFLQEAETVRVRGPAGTIPVTELAAGQEVYGAALPAGRHLGMVVHEAIRER